MAEAPFLCVRAEGATLHICPLPSKLSRLSVRRRASRRGIFFGVDALTQKRLSTLRGEIASLRSEDDRYRLQEHHTRLEAQGNESRPGRQLTIQEELVRMGLQPREYADWKTSTKQHGPDRKAS